MLYVDLMVLELIILVCWFNGVVFILVMVGVMVWFLYFLGCGVFVVDVLFLLMRVFGEVDLYCFLLWGVLMGVVVVYVLIFF